MGIDAIRDAGVVGAGGAGFPTHVKLNTQVEYFIVNAAECEPLIETDKYLCRTWPERIVTTVVKIAEMIGATKQVIALKDHYQREIMALQEAIDKLGAPVEIHQMRAFYPAGDEQSMVFDVTGRSIPERGLPSAVGCVVDNVGTVLSIADALEGKPVCEKFLSVTGAVDKPVMYHVPIGTPIRAILDDAGLEAGTYNVILGGPMMGKTVMSEEEIDHAVVTKTTGNLLVLPKDHYLFTRASYSIPKMIHQARSACIQCRMCTDLCPRYAIGHDVQPHLIMRNVWREEHIQDEAEFLRSFGNAMNCCSCGACEMFSCPMGLSPRKMNDYMKTRLRERGIQVPQNQEPVAREGVENRRIPTDRLIARLHLAPYEVHNADPELVEFRSGTCTIPMSQHIGKPAVPVVAVGDQVKKGDLVAQAAEGLSVNIHCGMDGVVKEVTPYGITISGKED